MSVPDMDANGNQPAGWLLFGLFPGEMPSTECVIGQGSLHAITREGCNHDTRYGPPDYGALARH
jgi:hypothetical protein